MQDIDWPEIGFVADIFPFRWAVCLKHQKIWNIAGQKGSVNAVSE